MARGAEEELRREMARQIPIYREWRRGIVRTGLACTVLAVAGAAVFAEVWEGGWDALSLAVLVMGVGSACSAARCVWLAAHWSRLIAKGEALQRPRTREEER